MRSLALGSGQRHAHLAPRLRFPAREVEKGDWMYAAQTARARARACCSRAARPWPQLRRAGGRLGRWCGYGMVHPHARHRLPGRARTHPPPTTPTSAFIRGACGAHAVAGTVALLDQVAGPQRGLAGLAVAVVWRHAGVLAEHGRLASPMEAAVELNRNGLRIAHVAELRAFAAGPCAAAAAAVAGVPQLHHLRGRRRALLRVSRVAVAGVPQANCMLVAVRDGLALKLAVARHGAAAAVRPPAARS
jgi:hypothetical protein